ncbi:hypothetical protein CY34DRAFT_806315 [Suillus luteus UH-Slu-Lm8-n1]|uniref:Uncharacterized protein n=1 Tax=Suillus luteus UH-Slu-Lm8-n1 TaxID=930992 RepID=A0A0D0B3Z9_9AGAM|nr:hypothetical protein CY34DRAFT_806315 [Suillus luteus UH-Slu-Lm8-n1]
MDVDAAEELLSKVLDVCHANSHIYGAALLAIKTSTLHPASLFNFLPLHAAGGVQGKWNVSFEQYIYSYVPSLTALMRAHRSYDMSPSVPFAAIGRNFSDSVSFTLDFVKPELVRSLLPLPRLFTLPRK